MGFIDELQSAKLDPLDGRSHVDFPFAEVSRALGEPQEESHDEARARDAEAFRLFMFWLLVPYPNMSRAALRVLAAAWCLECLEGSGNEVAARSGVSRQGFSRACAEFTRAFNIKNRYQSHDWRKDGEREP